jgi:multiple sugar transport system permease protein
MQKQQSTRWQAPSLGPARRLGRFVDRNFRFLAILPAIVVLVVLTLYPALQLLRLSVSQIELTPGGTNWTFVGLRHLHTMLADPVAPVAFRNTVVFVVGVVVVEACLGLLLALTASRVRVLGRFYRTIIILPILIPPIAIGTMWRLMFDYNYGVLNRMLAAVGVPGRLWLADPSVALSSVMLVDVWHWTSFMFLILLAGVESIPTELTEAAEIDGANEFQTFRHVLLPLLRSTIVVALMLRTIMAFKVFDVPYVLTGGGPGTATELISLYVEKVYFSQFRMGYGAFLALVTAAMISVFVIAYGRVTGRQGRPA